MRLEHFQYIVEIARCKSMSKASKKLFITQPSLSTAIQGLEAELGFQIFKRSAAGVALTEKGEALLHIAEDIVFQLEQIKELSHIRIYEGNDPCKLVISVKGTNLSGNELQRIIRSGKRSLCYHQRGSCTCFLQFTDDRFDSAAAS